MVSIMVKINELRSIVLSGVSGVNKTTTHSDSIEPKSIKVWDIIGTYTPDGIGRQGIGMQLKRTITLQPKDRCELLLRGGKAEGTDTDIVNRKGTRRGKVSGCIARQSDECVRSQ
jgi:hypothetical protein